MAHPGGTPAQQLALFDLGPVRLAAPLGFWTREEEDREDYRDVPHEATAPE